MHKIWEHKNRIVECSEQQYIMGGVGKKSRKYNIGHSTKNMENSYEKRNAKFTQKALFIKKVGRIFWRSIWSVLKVFARSKKKLQQNSSGLLCWKKKWRTA